VVSLTDFRTCKRALLKLGAKKAYYYETRKGIAKLGRVEARIEGAGVETEKGAAAGVAVKDEGLSLKVLKGSPLPFGPTARDGGVNFAIHSTQATSVTICLFTFSDLQKVSSLYAAFVICA